MRHRLISFPLLMRSILLVIGGVLFGIPVSGFADSDRLISQYDVVLDVQKDHTLRVKETIRYDFGEKEFNQFSRDLPLEGISVDVQKATATDQENTRYTTKREDGTLLIDVKSGEEKFSGRHTFTVVYTVTGPLWYQASSLRSDTEHWQRGAFRHYEDFDEVYWNAIGDQWDAPVANSTVTVNLPDEVDANSIKTSCYTGEQGSTKQECITQQNENTVTFTLDTTLQEAFFTVAVGFEKGVVAGVSSFEQTMYILMRRVLPGIVGVLFLALIGWLYYRAKNQYTLKRPIVRQYKPPQELRPAEVSRIYHQESKKDEFAATIVDLAVRGVIKIKEEEKDQFIGSEKIHKLELRDPDYRERDDLRAYETELLEKIFAQEHLEEEEGDHPLVNMETLNKKHALAKYASDIQKQIYTDMNGAEYFRSKPQRIAGRWIALGAILVFVGAGVALGTSYLWWGVMLAIVGVGFFLFGNVVPKRTQAGADMYSQIEGYRQYVNVAEEERLKFQEKENIFFELLPYAMVLGVADKWGKAFEDVVTEPPEWYEGSHGTAAAAGGFSTGEFAQSMESTGDTVSGSFSSSGGGAGGASGGGGAAGGGAGGGGGGAG